MKCLICSETCARSSEEFCEGHEKAYRTVIQKYGDWKTAMDISWKEYLGEILENPHTGSWAKEVAKKLISEKRARIEEAECRKKCGKNWDKPSREKT